MLRTAIRIINNNIAFPGLFYFNFLITRWSFFPKRQSSITKKQKITPFLFSKHVRKAIKKRVLFILSGIPPLHYSHAFYHFDSIKVSCIHAEVDFSPYSINWKDHRDPQ